MTKLLARDVTIHKSHDSVRTSVFKSRFSMFIGTAGLKKIDLPCNVMPYTHENTSNTIEDKKTKKSKTFFHCGPKHKAAGQDNHNIFGANMRIVTPLLLAI